MPKRADISSVLIIGAGPIVIGQACEFDYSGAQACKALKQEGVRVILVNSNPATIMTDPGMADATYIEPIEPAFLEKIIARERPDAVLPTMGGQTALNAGIALADSGVLEKYGCEMIGARADVIRKAEDRLQFRDAMSAIGLESPRSHIVKTLEEAAAALAHIGLPAIIRPSFTLGGIGGGIAYNSEEFERIVRGGLDASPVGEVLVEESVLGWKEYEMEVVRDAADNCIIICAIENVDPMGVHTGDSITVAPALTLTDKEYQIMRNASIACLREIGVETGGSNVQFAVNPEDGRLVVIEMNPRVSRSSALASKATGFPIAKVAARLAIGYTLDELQNDITGVTPASFEPTIDYVVTKIPRFTFEKFPGADPTLTTQMKSVGEAMAIGRNFAESLQKGLRSMETGLDGLDDIDIPGVGAGGADAGADGGADSAAADRDAVRAWLSTPRPDRILGVAQAFRLGLSMEDIHDACKYDPWFLEQIKAIVDTEGRLIRDGMPDTAAGWMKLKRMGFSDARLAALMRKSPQAANKENPDAESIRAARRAFGVRPVFRRVDTCAGEFAAKTSYMYSTYEGAGMASAHDEAEPTARDKVIILGGGPNRIGQGIEFDYCCVHAAYALREAGIEAVMVNCNPETVSTDYDTSDRLFFEPLTAEDVLELIETEKSNGRLLGVIVQFGGQTPLKLAKALEAAGAPILGTTPDAIDLAEDRERFQVLLQNLNLRQPPNGFARSEAEAERAAAEIGFPVVIRPSYVLGGRAMEIVHDMAALKRYIQNAVNVSGDSPVLIDGYLADAIEVDVDAVRDSAGDVYVAGVMEHIEEAGIHSGDSACSLPPHTLPAPVVTEIERQTALLAEGLGVVGLMNVQFAVQGEEIFILEVNPRASRTAPFVAKATGVPVAKIAARVMTGETLASFGLKGGARHNGHMAVKEAVFPFSRFAGVDIILGPEMKSTGEVMGLDTDFPRAFAKSQIGAGMPLPESGAAFISVRDRDKARVFHVAEKLAAMGFKLTATRGTQEYLAGRGLTVERVNKVLEGRPHCVDALISGQVQIVINTTEGARAIADSFSIRRSAVTHGVAHYTTMTGAEAAAAAIAAMREGGLEVAPLQSYFKDAG
ncbi:MAG: carbamoyl-phosphate synthase large subunit [Rhodospirillales bacterium]